MINVLNFVCLICIVVKASATIWAVLICVYFVIKLINIQ